MKTQTKIEMFVFDENSTKIANVSIVCLTLIMIEKSDGIHH